jgi:site-specific recombinase XerD
MGAQDWNIEEAPALREAEAGRPDSREASASPTLEQRGATWNPAKDLGAHFSRPISENTARAYAGDWKQFDAWCREHGRSSFPASGETVAKYLKSRGVRAASTALDFADAGTGVPPKRSYAVNTLVRWVSAINVLHRQAGHPPPGATTDVKTVLASARGLNSAVPRRMEPVSLRELRRALGLIDMNTHPAAIRGHRDWAILVLGFAGGFQRSELAALTFGDIQLGDPLGIRLCIPTARTVRMGRTASKLLPFGKSPDTCPACALLRWTRLLRCIRDQKRIEVEVFLLGVCLSKHVCREPQIELHTFDQRSAIFRSLRKGGHVQDIRISDEVVNDVVKLRLKAAGMDPKRYGAHSLRSGFIAEALRGGHPYRAIMLQTDHISSVALDQYGQRDSHSYRNPVLDLGV